MVKNIITLLDRYFSPDDNLVVQWIERQDIIETDKAEVAKLDNNDIRNPNFLTGCRWEHVADVADRKLVTDMQEAVGYLIDAYFQDDWEAEDGIAKG